MKDIKILMIKNARRGRPVYKEFTPGESSRWGNIVSVDDIDEADYLVVQDLPFGIDISHFPPDRVLYFTSEPDEFLFVQHWNLTLSSISSPRFSIDDGYRLHHWTINKTYDELKNMDFPTKTKNLSCVTSNWGDGTQPPETAETQVLSGHRLRMRFLHRFLRKFPDEMDLYGRLYGPAYSYKWNKGELLDKWDGLASYRYSFCIENSWQKGYFTEKPCDLILAGCMPIYWGCPNLEDFLPQGSFIRLDIAKEDAPERAIEIINSDFREKHLGALREAKELILDKYQTWPMLHKIINRYNEKMKEANMHTLDSNFYDREYFEGSSKSGYGGMYTKANEGPKMALIAQFLKSCFKGPMLDVGCAYGFLCAALQDIGVDAQGIDISEYSISNCLPQVKGKLSVCDVTQATPFKDREFPTVVAFQTMEHIEVMKIPLAVKEMCRISDEYIVLEVPTWYDDKTPDRSDTFDRSHVSFYSASFWVDQFYAEGFYLNVNLSHKLKGTDSSRLVFYRGDNVPARLKDDFKVIRVASEAEVKELRDDHYGVPKGYELSQPAQVKVGAAALKVLVISSTVYSLPPKGYSGLETLVYEWAVEFRKAGHKVAVVAPEGSSLPEGMELIPTALMVDESQAYPLYKERLGEFDVIMDNSWLWHTVLAQIEAGDRQLPVIHIYHSDPDFLPNPPPIKYPCLVGLSKEHARKIKERWGFEVHHNYNGIRLDFYQFNPEVQRNGRYLWCARYTPEKMPLETIRLAKKCNIPLDLYGNTSIIRDQNYLNQCMAECDAKDVVFHLEVPREETVNLYQTHKALIHLVNYLEAFGLVPVEAMACGMPVIVNRRGALPELVEDEFSGFVVDTIEQAEEIIRSGKVDSIKPEDCRKSAEIFSIERSAQGYLKLFREVAAGRVW